MKKQHFLFVPTLRYCWEVLVGPTEAHSWIVDIEIISRSHTANKHESKHILELKHEKRHAQKGYIWL